MSTSTAPSEASPPPDFVARCRAYGATRIDVVGRITKASDWPTMWPAAANPVPFQWGPCWRATLEIKVADYPAELGFYLDVLGFSIGAFVGADSAMLTAPDGALSFSIAAAAGGAATPIATISMQFMVADLRGTVETLRARGVPVAQEATPFGGSVSTAVAQEATPFGGSVSTAVVLTPCGHRITLWGMSQSAPADAG